MCLFVQLKLKPDDVMTDAAGSCISIRPVQDIKLNLILIERPLGFDWSVTCDVCWWMALKWKASEARLTFKWQSRAVGG